MNEKKKIEWISALLKGFEWYKRWPTNEQMERVESFIRVIKTNGNEGWTLFKKDVTLPTAEADNVESLLAIDFRDIYNANTDRWNVDSEEFEKFAAKGYSYAGSRQNYLLKHPENIKDPKTIDPNDAEAVLDYIEDQLYLLEGIKRIANVTGDQIPKSVAKAATAFKKSRTKIKAQASNEKRVKCVEKEKKEWEEYRQNKADRYDEIRQVPRKFTQMPFEINGVRAGVPMTHENANGNNANPFYSRKREKIFVNGEYVFSSYSVNCTLCCLAYEMRRRGYDVSAKPMFENKRIDKGNLRKGDDRSMIMKNWTYPYGDPATGKVVAETPVPAINARQAYDWMKANFVDGGRYILRVSWKGVSRYGHVMIAMKENGGVKLYDPQTGNNFATEKECLSQMERFKYPTFNKPNFNRISVLRCDNIDVDENLLSSLLNPQGAEDIP